MLFSQQLLTTVVSCLSCSSMILPLHCPLQNFALKCIYSGAQYLNFYPHQSNCAPVHSHYNTTELIEMTQCSTELLPQGCEPNCDRINSNWNYLGLLMQSAFDIPCNSTLRLASDNKHTLIQGWPCFDLQLLVETTWQILETQTRAFISRSTVFYVPGGTRYNCLDGKAHPKRSAFFRFQVLREREAYKREGISQVEAYKRGREIGHLVI